MRLYNTLSKKKEEFVPITPGEVKMYVCGPTVYNFFHVGNARPFIIFDVFRRYMEHKGFNVQYVQNFTDIDDKIINRANGEGVKASEIAEKYTAEYKKDAAALGINDATVHPTATGTMEEIIDFIKLLVEKGYAYPAGGDVYYNTKKFDGYGKLSHQPLEELELGARISPTEQKNDPMDFTLWKAAKPGEPSWESPWGNGRPGWHIECSAMAKKHLGETIDIHAGGIDLCFPHHENEIAQSEAANDAPFANYWLHNAFLNINNEKMSKSRGNFLMVRDAAEAYSYEAIRFFMLSAHYRSPINYSEDSLIQAQAALERLNTAIQNLGFLSDNGRDGDMTEYEVESLKTVDRLYENFCAAMEDDINTAEAIGVIFEMVREINTAAAKDGGKAYAAAACEKLMKPCAILGVGTWEQDSLDKEVELLIQQRQEARGKKDFAAADKIRNDLKTRGIILEDTPQGVKWYKEQ